MLNFVSISINTVLKGMERHENALRVFGDYSVHLYWLSAEEPALSEM